jgi:protocatechuate 3,4-dioxygenase beta subunit
MQGIDREQGAALEADLERLLRCAATRRTSLRWLLASAAALPAHGGAAAGGAGGSPDCALIPSETTGPFPADGANGSAGRIANALALSGIVRSDIRASIAGATGVASGIPLTIRLKLMNVDGGCTPLAGGAVYLWHCDRAGNYSMYSRGVTAENYLRGVQQADNNGVVRFITIVPGCYAGRMPHMHFEVYPSLASATGAANRIRTSQLTFPMATLHEVYGVAGYEASARNLAGISYATDNVFSDGTSLQMASVSGSPASGYVATLSVGVHL